MDTGELITYLLTPAAQVVIVIGLAEIIKRLGLETHLIPLVDLALGLISGIAVYHFGQGYELISSILIGIAIALSACGLFSGIKNITEGINNDE